MTTATLSQSPLSVFVADVSGNVVQCSQPWRDPSVGSRGHIPLSPLYSVSLYSGNLPWRRLSSTRDRFVVKHCCCGSPRCAHAKVSCSFFGNKLRRGLGYPTQTHSGHSIQIRSWVQANDVHLDEGPAATAQAKSLSDFIRFRDNGEDGLNLQTAIISYRKPFPFSIFQPNLQVDLVSAVHIADKDYFAALQEELGAYDRVLYEMVADKDPRQTNRNARTRWRPPRRLSGGRGRNWSFFALIQRSIAVLLALDFQLECMDYRKENWYHADLDYDTFCALQLARGESLFTFARELAVISLKTITRSSMMPANVDPWRAKLLWASKALPMPLVGLFLIEGFCAPPDAPLRRSPEMKALLDLDLPAAIKVLLAKQIATDFTEDAALVVENSVIIGERNRVAMEELKEALRDGCKKVSIFYGGGHMPDMDRRLQQQFGLVPSKVHWRTAWSMIRKRQVKKDWLSTILSSLAKVSGWPLDRYQTSALLLLSWVLAIDLWFWELLLDGLNKYCNESILPVVQLLDKAWGL